jgi:histone deacetylase complex regulatory component SIN3
MKKIIALTILFLGLFFATIAFARSGCCSHHSGVCGCRCCDGTSLSATCAPYYPSCQQVAPTPQPIQQITTPKITIPSASRISEFNQALTYAQSQSTAYSQNPNGFREKLIIEMLKKYKTLKLDNIGLIVYSTLQDIK